VVIAISTDDVETLKKFRDELKAPYPFVSDPKAEIVAKYAGTMPVVGYASRATFVVGQDRKVLSVQTGKDAIEPGGAIKACPIRKPKPAGP
jgi:thioredoxin-dependent peroxiredoxin